MTDRYGNHHEMKVLHPIMGGSELTIKAERLDEALAKARTTDKITDLLYPKLEDIETSQIRSEGLEKLLLDVWRLINDAG